jgi:hypothetical protein
MRSNRSAKLTSYCGLCKPGLRGQVTSNVKPHIRPLISARHEKYYSRFCIPCHIAGQRGGGVLPDEGC